MAMSACEGDATTVDAEALLFAGIGSLVAEETAGLFEITVPGAVPTFTLTMRGKLADVFAAIVARVQLTDPVPPTGGVLQLHPAGTPSETNVVFAGIVSVKVLVKAGFGPLFDTVCEKVMLFPARTGLGDAEVVTARSVWVAPATVTFAVAVLLDGLGSGVADETVAVSDRVVPEAVPALTLKTGWNVADAPAARVAMVHVMVPVPPTDGVMQDQPAGGAREKKVVFVGTVSVKLTEEAADGPAFMTGCVKVTFVPAATGFGDPLLVMVRSAPPGEVTSVVTLDELLLSWGSTVPELTEAMSVIWV